MKKKGSRIGEYFIASLWILGAVLLFFVPKASPNATEPLNWIEEATVVSSEIVVRNSHKVCSFTVSKEGEVESGEATFFANKRVCSNFEEAGVEKVDVGFNDSLEVEKLTFYILGLKVEYE